MFLYPWGDMHSLNLGWFLLQYKEWVEKIQEYLDNGGGTSENLANVIAPVFNAANSYLTGDYVLYNNELYKALEPVPPGTWNPDAWERCLVTEEMGSSGSGVDNVARLMIAGQYSNTYNYQKYAICRYADKLWMCNTNLPAGGEEWEPSHWDEITVGAGLTGLRRSVESLSNDIIALNGAITSKTDYLDIGNIPGTAVTREEAIAEAFNRINIYDKPIVIKFYWSGYWSGIAYKYTDGLYGTIYATFPVNNASYFGYMSNGTMHIVAVATDDTLNNLKQVNTSYFGTGNELAIESNGYVVQVHTINGIAVSELIGATLISDASLRPKTKILSQAVLREIGVGYRSALAFLNANGTITLNDPDNGAEILNNTKYDYAIIDYTYPKK